MAEIIIAIGLAVASVVMAVTGAVRYKRKATGRYPHQPVSDEAAARIFERFAAEAVKRNEALLNPGDDYDAAVDRAVRIGERRTGLGSDTRSDVSGEQGET